MTDYKEIFRVCHTFVYLTTRILRLEYLINIAANIVKNDAVKT